MNLETQEIQDKQPFYSFHCFMFPFKWEYNAKKELFEDKTNAKEFVGLLAKKGTKWIKKETFYPPKTIAAYNEVNYFHKFAWDALYDTGKADSQLHHYQYDLLGEASYDIKVKDRNYTLNLNEIILNIYDSGVGVLSFRAYNKKKDQSSPNDIALINQFGRRLYPPFFGSIKYMDKDEKDFFQYDNFLEGISSVKNIELAESIHIKDANGVISEDLFQLTKLPPEPAPTSPLITNLFDEQTKRVVKIIPAIDDRMFVLSWYGNKRLAEELKIKKEKEKEELKGFVSNDWWYRFVFVDGGYKSIANDEIQEEQIKKHTNARWVNYGTLFGTTRYSFVCITSEFTEFTDNFIVNHVQTMYAKMAELCLVQRTSLLKFSDEISEVSKLKDLKGLAGKVSSLYKEYIRFVNKIYFREITAQEQGIELYGSLLSSMRTADDVKELDGEIQELHQYVQLKEEEARNSKLDVLTYIGAGLVLPAFVVGFFGMNIDNNEVGYIMSGLVISTILIFWYLNGEVTKTKKVILFISIIIALAFMVWGYISLMPDQKVPPN